MLQWRVHPGFLFPLFLPLGLYLALDSPPSLAMWELLLLWFSTLLFHELAHVFVWRSLGYLCSIKLSLPGPSTRPLKAPSSRWHEVVAALAGPLTNVLLVVIACSYADFNQPLTWIWISMNVGWGTYQLFPIASLDGWYLLKSLLEIFFQAIDCFQVMSSQICHAISLLFCLLLTLVLLMVGSYVSFLPSAISMLLFFQAWVAFKESRNLGLADLAPQNLEAIEKAIELYQKGQGTGAQALLKNLIGSGQTGQAIYRARFLLAQWTLETGRAKEAWALIEAIPMAITAQAWALIGHKIAYQSEQFTRVHQLGPTAFKQCNDASIAIMNAIAASHLYREAQSDGLAKKQAQLALEVVGWLQAARRLRFANWSILLGSDFESLRGDEAFERFCSAQKKT